MPGQAGGGDVLQQRDERLPALPGQRQLGDVVGGGGASGPYGVSTGPDHGGGGGVGVRCRRRGRRAGGRRRGRGSGRAGRRTRRRGGGWRAGSPRRRGVPRRGGAGSRLPRRCRGPGTPAVGSRRPAAPGVPGWRPRSTISVSALARRSSPRSAGRASSASVITRTWARFRSPVAKASATPAQRRSRASASAAWRRTAPGLSRVGWPASGRWTGRRSRSAMSSAAARTRSFTEAMRVSRREQPSRVCCFSLVVR